MGGEGQHVERAPMLIECNRLEEARSALMEALASSPDDAEILTLLGMCCRRRPRGAAMSMLQMPIEVPNRARCGFGVNFRQDWTRFT